MVVVLNDLKYMLCNYIAGMQNALVEDFTYTLLNREQRNDSKDPTGESMMYYE